MFPKSSTAFLAVSLAVHTFCVAGLYYSGFVPESDESTSVQVELVQSSRAPMVVVDQKPSKASAEKVSTPVTQPKELSVSRKVTLSKEFPATLKPAAYPRRIEKRSVHPSVEQTHSRSKPATASIARSDNLLADPEKGKVFASYFAKIKEKIQNRVQRKYSYENIGEGSVMLLFVLDSDGSLDNVSVLEKHSTGSGAVKDFAMQCVRDAAPFDRFPSELGLNKISFNLTVLFQEV